MEVAREWSRRHHSDAAPRGASARPACRDAPSHRCRADAVRSAHRFANADATGDLHRRMIIPSLLDTDLYKFTMMQVVLHHFPAAQVEYRFKCRNAGVDLQPYIGEIRREIARAVQAALHAARARLPAQLAVHQERLRRSPRAVPARRAVHPRRARCAGSGEIDITIKGPWLHTILFEVPVLAIVSEVYNRNMQPQPDFAEGRAPAARRRSSSSTRVPDPDVPHRRLRHAPALLARLAGAR